MLRDKTFRKHGNGSDRGPLRKVVGTVYPPEYPGVRHELLECGHSQPPREDIIGETNAYRRRCWRCKRATTQKGGE